MEQKITQKSSTNYRDLTGMQFGELTVLECLGNQGKSNGIRWLCRCSCGAMYETLGTLLVTGRRTRCSGSAHKKNYASADIRNRKFNLLTALEPVGRRDSRGSVIWRCRCDCGNEIEISYNSLVYTSQISCGCRKKEKNEQLRNHLTHVAGTSLEMLKSKKIPKDNTTGYKGVYRIRGKYVAKIVFRKKQYFLGTYDRIEEAAQARREAETILFDGTAEYYQKWKKAADMDAEWAERNPFQVIVEQSEGKLHVTFLPSLLE